jgi:histidyl-tRNA synthetase
VSDREQEKAAKRAQWEEINRAKAAAKEKAQATPAVAESRPTTAHKQFQAIRGTRDLLPPDTQLWNHVEQTAREVFRTFGFGEIRPPIFEPKILFARAVGGETDIVSKELYGIEEIELEKLRSFLTTATMFAQEPNTPMFGIFALKICQQASDELEQGKIPKTALNIEMMNEFRARREKIETDFYSGYGDSSALPQHTEFLRQIAEKLELGEEISLRPEATASVCRAYIEHNMQQLPQPVKLYYNGPMFRRERPQKGRYRQFYQIGAEVLEVVRPGQETPEAKQKDLLKDSITDAEVIEMLMTFFDRLGLHGVELNINSIGHSAPPVDGKNVCRRKYVETLKSELEKVKDKLGADSQRRIDTNPLRVLDSKLEHEQSIIAMLPKIADHLCDDCKVHYAALKRQLELRGVLYKENWRLVRGLDYYMRTTFEITAQGLGSQDAVCGGGRYDGLVELLGGPPTKGIGFAIGEDRLILSLQATSKAEATQGRDVYIAWMGEHAYATAIRAAKDLRKAGFSVELPPTELKFGKALERATKLNSRFALILGDNEVSEGLWTLKNLADGTQEKYTEPQLLEFLKGL